MLTHNVHMCTERRIIGIYVDIAANVPHNVMVKMIPSKDQVLPVGFTALNSYACCKDKAPVEIITYDLG